VLGPESAFTANVLSNLAELLSSEGRLSESEEVTREALAINLRALGPENPYTLLSKSNLAEVLLREGRLKEAEKLQRETFEAMSRVLGPEHPGTLECQSLLAGVLNREGRYAEAEKLARAAFEIDIRTLGPEQLYTLDALQRLGIALAHTHRYSEADKLFHDVIEKQTNSAANGSPWVWYDFASVAEAGNRPSDALRYLQEAINRGYKDANALMADNDLKNLRGNPQFQQIIGELQHSPQDQHSRTQ
jgi:tetratricopeptide (TPR) repeat protein